METKNGTGLSSIFFQSAGLDVGTDSGKTILTMIKPHLIEKGFSPFGKEGFYLYRKITNQRLTFRLNAPRLMESPNILLTADVGEQDKKVGIKLEVRHRWEAFILFIIPLVLLWTAYVSQNIIVLLLAIFSVLLLVYGLYYYLNKSKTMFLLLLGKAFPLK